MKSTIFRGRSKLIFFILGAAFVLIRTPLLIKEFTIEEPHIVKAAAAISNTGYPRVYMGEQSGHLVNLWKPPGLVFLVASSFKLFGISELSARTIPLLFSLGQLGLMILFITKIFPGTKGKKIAVLAGTLFTIHPYSIQTSTQVDIDGGVFAFFAAAVMIAGYFISERKFTLKGATLWLILTHLAFTTKFEPTLMILSLFGLFSLTDPKRRRALLWIIPTSFLSLGSFFLWFSHYNSAFSSSQTASMPIDIIIHVFNTAFLRKLDPTTDLFIAWNGSFALIARLASWATMPLVVVTLTQLPLLKQKLKTSLPVRFLTFWSFGLFAIYILFGFAGLFPRYFAPAMPAYYLLIATLLVSAMSPFNLTKSLKYILFSVLLWFPILLTGRTPLFRVWEITQFSPLSRLFILFVFLIVIYVLTSTRLGKKAALSILTTITIVTLVFQSSKDIISPEALTNGFGQWGNKLSGQYLSQTLSPTDAIISTDPIGYYYHQPYFDVNLIFPYPDRRQTFNQEFKSVKAIALPDNILEGYLNEPDNPLRDLISQTKRQHQFGNIKVILLSQ